MDAVLGFLGRVGGVLGKIFAMLGSIVSKLSAYSHLIFLVGFFGILLAFLWFFFWYLDRRKLVLPTIAFILFFVMFLSGGTLLLFRSSGDEAPAASTVEALQPSGEESGEEGKTDVNI